ESGIGLVVLLRGTEPAAVFDRVFPQIHVRNVLQFIAVLRIVVNAAAAASPRKGSLNRNRGRGIQWILIAAFSNESKARFVDRARVEHLCVCRLKSVLAAE